MMKRSLEYIISLAVLATCDSSQNLTHSNTKDHVITKEGGFNYIVYENLDDNMFYLSKCKTSDLQNLEKIYSDNPTQAWNNSRNHPCHKPAIDSSALNKTQYMNGIWNLLDIGTDAEAKVQKSINTLIAQINTQIKQHTDSEGKTLFELSEIEKNIKLLTDSLEQKKSEKTIVLETIDFLNKKLTNNPELDATTVENLQTTIARYKQNVQALDTEMQTFKNRLETIKNSETTEVKPRLEKIRAELEKSKQSLQQTTANLDTELNKLRNQRKPIEDSIKPGKMQLLQFSANQVLPSINKLFYPPNKQIRISTEGLLEMKYQGEWRGVCNDSFFKEEGTVACRQLGGRYVKHEYKAHASNNAAFWLDFGLDDGTSSGCNGNEDHLLACNHNPIGEEDCTHSEWVALTCSF